MSGFNELAKTFAEAGAIRNFNKKFTKLVQEDECAPDSREFFNRDMITHTKMSLNEFKELSESTEQNGVCIFNLNGFSLQWSWDDPFFILYKIND